MSNDVSNELIKNSFQNVVQYRDGQFYDLVGNLISGSNDFSASFAQTASFYTNDDSIVYAIALGGL